MLQHSTGLRARTAPGLTTKNHSENHSDTSMVYSDIVFKSGNYKEKTFNFIAIV